MMQYHFVVESISNATKPQTNNQMLTIIKKIKKKQKMLKSNKIITNQCNPVKCCHIFEIQQNVLAKSWKSCECYKTLKICEPAIKQTKIS